MTSTIPDPTVGPPPPFDTELDAALDMMRERLAVTGSFGVADIPALRATQAELLRVSDEDLHRDGAYVVSERVVPGPSGEPDISLLICLPARARTPVAAIYHIHGGGMIMGDRRLGVPGFLAIGEELEFAVVSVEYRLAPEHPHPAPIEDCYAGLLWTVEHVDDLGIDPDRILVAGGSAGGGLAAATALLARDRGGPRLIGQVLACPMLDDRNNSYSARQMAGLGIWDQHANGIGWRALLGAAQGGPDVSPYAAPARATDLAGLPPAYLDVGSAETFRDEVLDYAARIWRAGGNAELHVWPGGFHGFAAIAQAALSQDAGAALPLWLRRVLGS
ncbi:MAG TPA: alpha/beta hydrolase fold domain-containing protein [Pseudonocardiaceae bacterium]|jgi:acetyl esterase/lipase|nr:alpha/beta hydrolase fold domain-containing protein [Pseudonocardiaceae bacterium]